MTDSGRSVVLQDSARGSTEEERQLAAAAEHLRGAQVGLARAGAILGHTDRKGWWYEANKLYDGAYKLAETLEAEQR